MFWTARSAPLPCGLILPLPFLATCYAHFGFQPLHRPCQVDNNLTATVVKFGGVSRYKSSAVICETARGSIRYETG
jgi:hypothetical protein